MGMLDRRESFYAILARDTGLAERELKTDYRRIAHVPRSNGGCRLNAKRSIGSRANLDIKEIEVLPRA